MICVLLYIKRRHYGALLSEDPMMVHLTIYVKPVAAWDVVKSAVAELFTSNVNIKACISTMYKLFEIAW